MYKGQAVSLKSLDEGLVELEFDLQNESVNKLNNLTLKELGEAVRLLADSNDVKGLLITSTKPAFIVGADIAEFQDCFSLPLAELHSWIRSTLVIFSEIENLPFPTVAAVNNLALGGGFELALCADIRVTDKNAHVGFHEVNLGICPGWGGTVRLSRLIGIEEALSWMMSGRLQKAEYALSHGAVDRIAHTENLRDEALQLLHETIEGSVSYIENRERTQLRSRTNAVQIGKLREKLRKKLDPNYPAASSILDAVATHCLLPFDKALSVETDMIVALARNDAAKSLIGLFINDQILKKKAKAWTNQAAPVNQTAVLGAGIMGGGVAYQSASKGIPIIMKDIRDDALQLGLKTASELLDKQIEKNRLIQSDKEQVLQAINTTLEYSGFNKVDLVVEAVVENPKIKKNVLEDVEKVVPESAVLTSNTSTISIDFLAKGLSRPEKLCGMHFFNPVHLMPLVEVIRGSKTNDQTVARAVAYASAMGKSPIVVKDCPGFLVNRILFPYLNGFNRLLKDGVNFQRIDHVMEQFGWPMGPAYLVDVVGIDTVVHADHVMQDGFPERMGHDCETIIEALLAADCLGQKNGRGFYEYGVDENGRRYKNPAGVAQQLIADRVSDQAKVSDQEIIDRMMIPMCLETVRCLEDGIVESAAEADMGLILGLGFPRFRGGALRYIDTLGLEDFANKAEGNRQYGALYQLTDGFKERLAENRTFY